ncbi:MAG TPA: sulfatase-like hydrolase/transferase, partial [Thermoguttaceae bacterium]|nr:sulfatase-like hydrolase/transferase [Thermoguttaceae bacterium]
MKRYNRLIAATLAAATVTLSNIAPAAVAGQKPNVILCMADDQGWGDTGYNGNPVVKTPNLDEMARTGIRFDRFYSGAPVCSPTRGSVLTGRHPYRYGIPFANTGHMLPEEITLAEALKTQGYTTGHFGKWHLGTLTTTMKDSNRGKPGDATHFSPPAQNGFDVAFSTEAKVPTWDPMKKPGTDQPYGTHYFNTDGSVETENLEGDDSRIIMDRAVPFIREAAARSQPFLAVIWFHTPHLPVVAGPEYAKMYEGVEGAHPDYHGCITAMDDQVGRLRKELDALGVAENTMLWFCADNGPEGNDSAPGSAGPFRGRKRSLFEGGVRVPGILVWPAKVTKPRVVDMPCSTLDYFPTVLDVLGFQMKGQPKPVDGISLLPMIEGTMTERPRPIGFQSSGQVSLVDSRYKLIKSGGGKKKGQNGDFML